jgi:ASCH domain
MKALSIKQPWASLIAHGIKNIENRTWKTKFRGRIFIHASAKDAGALYELLNEKQIEGVSNHWTAAPPFPDRPVSAIIGEVDIVDCVINHQSIWAEKSDWQEVGWTEKQIYNWVLANPVLYDKPILNVKGKLSFWEFKNNH